MANVSEPQDPRQPAEPVHKPGGKTVQALPQKDLPDVARRPAEALAVGEYRLNEQGQPARIEYIKLRKGPAVLAVLNTKGDSAVAWALRNNHTMPDPDLRILFGLQPVRQARA